MPDTTAPDLHQAALQAELRAAQPELRSGGVGCARALHSLLAAAAAAGDAPLAAALRAAQSFQDDSPDPAALQAELRRLNLLDPASPTDPPTTVRVDVRKLDALLALAGELTSARLHLDERVRRARAGEAGAWRAVRSAQQTLRTLTDDLAREVLAARLEPARPFLLSFERAVRDAARQTGKRVSLQVGAAEADLDRHAMERLRSPLLHLIRNAVDHGIDPPGPRQARGVPPGGTVTLAAYSAAGQVTVTVHDDGPGIDYAELTRAARRLDPPVAGTPADLNELLFTPGFSSRAEVTDLSGRGVGLDVVRTQARALGGDVTLRSGPGGTTVTIRFPLTLATTRVAVVRAAGQLLAVPVNWVERAGRTCLLAREGRPAVRVGDHTVPATVLAAELGLGPARNGAYLLVRQGESRLAVLVDALVGEEELVVKPLAFPLAGAPHLEGTGQLPGGQVVPVLNVRHLRPARGLPEAPAAPRAARVLLAEDTAVTRQMLRGVLQEAGFEVTAVADGLLAWESLNRAPPDLLLTDVEMPHLSGLELTRRVRAHSSWPHLPVVLLTSLDRPQDRTSGAEAGADAYLVKGEFDEAALLGTLRRLL